MDVWLCFSADELFVLDVDVWFCFSEDELFVFGELGLFEDSMEYLMEETKNGIREEKRRKNKYDSIRFDSYCYTQDRSCSSTM